MRRTSLTAWCMATAMAAAVSTQSLADIARKEAERRKDAPKASKVYTNKDLKTEPASSRPAGVPSPTSAKAEPGSAADDAKTEADWRRRVADAREALSRAQILQDALQSRINALTADAVTRDDPAQRHVIAADRQKALAELDRVRRDIEQGRKAIAGIEEDARRAGIPPGWVR